ncbi:hypothetical protein [Catenuloplanes indicus]|uniref:Uncharacterized protein n=1 Tax=Catenuloplanes indicus TaxID=137267 RepID=A0AAE3W6E5_9ACTN|nr:hypothetical protein [Catenuloplanes indicus]MDQ0370145.1 hypothetical protein [Catenuloplanes indicus]
MPTPTRNSASTPVLATVIARAQAKAAAERSGSAPVEATHPASIRR